MKNISIFLSSISRKKWWCLNNFRSCSKTKKLDKNVCLNSLLGKLDFYIYRPKYFNLNDFVISSFPINFLRNKEINILKKFLNFLLNSENSKKFDLVIDASILEKSLILKLKRKGSKILLNHAGSPAAFKNYFLSTKTFDDYLEFCSHYDGLIFQSKRQMNKYLEFDKEFMKNQKFFCCIPPANEEQIKNILERKESKNRKKKKIACIGSIQSRKNQHEIINYAVQLKKISDQFEFQIVGNSLDKSYVSKLKELILFHKLENHISLLGFRDDYLEIMLDSDFIVHPSKDEGVSRIIREAMALGKMVIAYDLDGTLDLVSEKNELYICQNENQMIEAIKNLFINSEQIKKYEKKSYKRYWKDLSEQNYINSLEKFLNEYI